MNFKKVAFILICFFAQGTFASAGTLSDQPGQITDDQDLVNSIKAQKSAYYVQAANLLVIKLLPDDLKGSPHQKWVAQTSSGDVVDVVFNTDNDRVPIKVGDHFSIGGQMLWLGHTAMIHWTHDDPKGKRPDGYIYLNNTVYGDWDHEDTSKP